MLLAGDLGGTKTLLGLFERAEPRPRPFDVREFVTLDYDGLPSMIEQFVATSPAPTEAIEAACFGVAGPIHHQTADLTNVPWRVSAADITARLGLSRLWLLNDVEAMAWSLPLLTDEETAVLQRGRPSPGTVALVTAGTGLGQALLHRVDGRVFPIASEGGHADFAARTDQEIGLLRALRERFGRVDVERVVSGPGLANVAWFTHDGPCPLLPEGTDPADVPAFVSTAGMSGECEACREALDLFVRAFGSTAGNLAVQAVARGGLFIGGGIPPKILPALQDGRFMDAFLSKPPMEDLLEAVPVRVILNAHTGLIGASVYASQMH
jgi:glucokinase